MEQRTLVPDAGEVALDQLMVEDNARLVMVLRATGEASHCPECREQSRRIHSHYRRRLSDLPWEGIPVRIELRVRRFFCDSEDCGQQVFTERLPKTVQRYSRRTCRLSTSLQQITSALGGSAGARLAKQLGILASTSTLLRQLRRRLIESPTQGPRVLGIDDWAWRKGHRYGTILCDLERGKVVEPCPNVWRIPALQMLQENTDWNARDRKDPNCDVPAPTVSAKRINLMMGKFGKHGVRPRLFLDELDKVAMTPAKAAVLSEIVDAVYQHKGQLVTTSNLGYQELAKKWGSDTDAGAVIRRFGSNDEPDAHMLYLDNLSEKAMASDDTPRDWRSRFGSSGSKVDDSLELSDEPVRSTSSGKSQTVTLDPGGRPEGATRQGAQTWPRQPGT